LQQHLFDQGDEDRLQLEQVRARSKSLTATMNGVSLVLE